MNWGGVRRARLLADLYLVAFAGLWGGLACVLAAQLTGVKQLALGGFVFSGSVITMFVLASALRDHVPPPTGRLAAMSSNSTRAYRRLTVGVELGRAWRVLVK
ncbi:hypothetical protein ACFV9C_14555 [Kribbella sp. NPDC059898]|uniref:hypothetical protein n=1 Tax=Kribbella sp. NPDC059898 TaxID=3346995 RepID=UPI003662BE77